MMKPVDDDDLTVEEFDEAISHGLPVEIVTSREEYDSRAGTAAFVLVGTELRVLAASNRGGASTLIETGAIVVGIGSQGNAPTTPAAVTAGR
jgi:hypothetical protein